MKKVFALLGLVLVALATYVTFFSPKPELLTPLAPSGRPNSSSLFPNSYVVLGFAPYWNLKKLSGESLESITHFAYFNLHLNGDGTIYTKINRREEDPGYTNYKRLVNGSLKLPDKPLIITFMPESQTALAESIASSANRQKTISTILSVVQESKARGVNIDYEPLGDISPSTRDNFTKFIQELHSALLIPMLTISTYASAAVRPRLWDLASLSQYTDYFVVMTYDYTMPGSTIAGPNSPLRGSPYLFEHDIVKNISEITKLIPSTKVLLGIPFYGYQWDTVDTSKYSPSESKGVTASLERIQSMLDDKTLEMVWDRNTLTPYGIASQSGQTTQIYFENPDSLRLKMEFVRSANLGGIAIWALGYEGNGSWVWPIISRLLR
jgi:spore germination protein YaaH